MDYLFRLVPPGRVKQVIQALENKLSQHFIGIGTLESRSNPSAEQNSPNVVQNLEQFLTTDRMDVSEQETQAIGYTFIIKLRILPTKGLFQVFGLLPGSIGPAE